MASSLDLPSSSQSFYIRPRLEAALAGEPVEWPVYAIYDWFVKNRPIDWPSLFGQGLGQINHACVLDESHPHLEIVETLQPTPQGPRRDVRWVTDRGELHEWYLGKRIRQMVRDAGDRRFCMMISEDVPPNWQETVPLVLQSLRE